MPQGFIFPPMHKKAFSVCALRYVTGIRFSSFAQGGFLYLRFAGISLYTAQGGFFIKKTDPIGLFFLIPLKTNKSLKRKYPPD